MPEMRLDEQMSGRRLASSHAFDRALALKDVVAHVPAEALDAPRATIPHLCSVTSAVRRTRSDNACGIDILRSQTFLVRKKTTSQSAGHADGGRRPRLAQPPR